VFDNELCLVTPANLTNHMMLVSGTKRMDHWRMIRKEC